MNVSRAWVRGQAARRTQEAVAATLPVTEGWSGGALTVFVQGRPRHFKGSLGKGKVGHTQRWREKTADAFLRHAAIAGTMQVRKRLLVRPIWPWTPEQPKAVTFTVYSRNAFDDDNLELVASPARDGLKDAVLVDDDKKSSGHAFTYNQVVTRKAGATHGIAVMIALKGGE